MSGLQLRVVSQEQELVNSEVSQVTAPSEGGEITILPGHAALVAQLQVGELTYVINNKPSTIVVSAGFLSVSRADEVIVIVDSAVDERNISLQKAEAAVKAAQQTVVSSKEREELIRAEASLRRAMLEVKVALRSKKTKI
ncbi:MAG: ATP synthase F1 subunit epsilon [Candidatus Pacebacteria bacterium]|nr:ATP synthase F1 subunit epsilon [Candidatus Paceibacterota bacterium]PIR60562.1 MAG: ATP synthase F1 subunit epsilon [Candidatus Pacebacteria bacterium CG10_big_fil_rev_8_21_14_0_10_45_6]